MIKMIERKKQEELRGNVGIFQLGRYFLDLFGSQSFTEDN